MQNTCPVRYFVVLTTKNKWSMDKNSNTWMVIISGFLAFFEPIAGNTLAMGYLFVVNFLVGTVVATVILKEKFSIQKAIRCLIEAGAFFGLSASIYICGKFNGNESGAIQTVSLFVYVVLWIYGRNVFKNLRRAFVHGSMAWMVVDFIYNAISFEFVKGIPGLASYTKEHETD